PADVEAGEKPSVADQTAGFDDKTDKAVGKPAIAQTDGNSDITITPTPAEDTDGNAGNDAQNADANKVAVKFDASHLAPSTAKALGLKVNVAQDGTESVANDQILIATKQPNGSWKLAHSTAKTLDEALNAEYDNEFSAVSDKVATIDANGKITLKKDVVNGVGGTDGKSSVIEAKAEDAYGNKADADTLTAKHNDPEQPIVVADTPRITDLGGGKATITLGNNNDGMEVNIGGTKYTVSKSVDPTKGEYAISPVVTSGVEFDPITGRITVTNTTPTTIEAEGKVGEVKSDKVSATIDPATDPTPNDTDPAELVALVNGDVEVRPGADNKTIRIKYTDNSGATQEVVLTKTNGTWTSPSDKVVVSADGKITLKASAVKDMTEVTAIGNNGKQDQQGNASAYPFVDDATAGQTGDNANVPNVAKAASNDDVVITKGADNHKLEIKYVPTGSADNNDDKLTTLTAQLEKGGSWSLKDKDGFDVPPEVATIDDKGNVTLKRGALNGGSKVKVTGFDLDQEASAQDYTVTGNAPSAGGSSPAGETSEPGRTEAGGTTSNGNPNVSDGTQIYRSNGLTIKQTGDENLFVKYDPSNSVQDKTIVEFKVWDNTDPTVPDDEKLKTLRVTMDGGGFYSVTSRQYELISGDGVATPLTAEQKQGLIYDADNQSSLNAEDQNTANQIGSGTAAFLLKSTSKIRLVADSPLEPRSDSGQLLTGRTSGDLLDIDIKGGFGSPFQRNPVKAYLQNTGEWKGPITKLQATEEPTATALTGADTGAVEITPKDSHKRLSVKYISERGEEKTALLEKEGNAWVVKRGNEADFNVEKLKEGKVILLADALKDNQSEGVVVRAQEEGKLYSSNASATPGSDPVPPAPPVPEKSLNDIISSIGTTPHTQKVDRVSKGLLLPTEGAKALDKFVQAEGGSTNGYTDYTLTDRGEALHINGSLNYGGAALLANSGSEFKLDMKGGDDVVIIENILRRTNLNLGEGNNLLAVGTANPDVVLYENRNATDPLSRYKFVEAGKNPPAGYQKVENVGNDSGGKNGGNIFNSQITGGNGDDVILIGGSNSGGVADTRAAVTKDSTINLNGGNDTLIIAPLTQGNTGDIQGKVYMGAGDDKLSAPAIAQGGKVYMGDGNDVAVFNRMSGGSSTLLDMGKGDDRVEFTAYGKETFMDGIVNGGAGYDTFVLRKPSADNGELVTAVFAGKAETHLSASKLISIEEVRMEKGTAIDISADYLRKGNIPVLKLLAEGDKSAGSVGGKDARLVDLGANNLNNDTNQNLGEFTKSGTKVEGSVTYDVYTAQGVQVWIEQNGGFTII
ncbi:hypothetical protein ACWIUH_11870, partial [Ursidibacter arcticus]